MLSFLSVQMCLLSSVEFLCLAWRNDAVWFLCLVLKSVSVSPMYVSEVLLSSILFFIMKVGYNARYHWLKERVLLEYKTRSWVKAVTPSAKLYYVRPFFKLLSSFFSLIENDIFRTSEPGSSNRKTKPRFLNMPNAVIYVTITWTETRILKEKTKWTVRV